MPCSLNRLFPVLVLCFATLPATAVTVTRIDIHGVSDARLADNVRSALSLQDAVGKDLSKRRLAYLLHQANTEVRQALEPFGYYTPVIQVQRSDRGAVAAEDAESDTDTDPNTETARTDTTDAQLIVSIHIDPGLPVRVRSRTLDVAGAAAANTQVRAALALFVPQVGQVLDHSLYEASKTRVNRVLAAQGYFDADFIRHQVEVTRAQHAADIDLRWSSGPRYRLGEAEFVQTPTPIIREDVLRKLVGWAPGAAYDVAELERLRKSLVALDYFGLVDVSAPAETAQNKQVPVQVNLTPAPRSIYSYGLSYGTRSGAGFSTGFERRYLNQRGHKALAQIDWGNQRKTATVQYRIPAFAWRDGWYTASLQAADEQTNSLDNRRLEFVASRSGQYNEHLNLVASAHVLRERWSYFTVNKPVGLYQFASFVFPELRADYINVDNRMAPRSGFGGGLTLRGGNGNATGFVQLHANAQWFHGFDADSRLIVRGEAGRTFTGALLDLPPSLRYFAGGDRSVRGYGWREIGPRIRNSQGDLYAVGASNVVTTSIEYERYLNGPWGAAVFVDSGSAFDGRRADPHTGVGIGLRWRSPVGPVRIDIARGLNRPESPFTLHLNIGADL
ncbi:autotransporter assembly complex family protein [Thermomonas sp.]|uniref:autotransporter assembly complex family protein n=1 Tax=Thermomonas sp. TaxID=1971895 RepID=UPI00378427E6